MNEKELVKPWLQCSMPHGEHLSEPKREILNCSAHFW